MRILLMVFNAFAICLSSENIPPMSGFYTEGLDKNLDKIEIVYPEKVSKDGSFVSYYLPHYYNIESSERPRRTPGFHGGSAKDAVHFFIPIEGEKHHLELWPNINFISPSLVVERRDARDIENVNKAKISQVSQRQCHYSGQIVGRDDSSAALSTCYGLAGYIRVPAGDEYMIEPVKDSKPTHNKEHPHIIYKRSGKKDSYGGTNCLTKGRAKEALEERMQWETLFGDKVRKEMSGINVNEIMQDDNRAMFSEASHENMLSPNSVGKENPQSIGIINHHYENNLPERNARPLNEPQLPGSNAQALQYSKPLNNETPDKNGNVGQLNLGNKLNQNLLKEERNMGNVQLPQINPVPSQIMQTEIDEDYSGQLGLTNSGEKQIMYDNYEHNRFKREINCSPNVLEIEKKEKQDQIVSGHDNSKNVRDEQYTKRNKIKYIKNINQRAIKPISSSKTGVHKHLSSNNALDSQSKKSKREYRGNNEMNEEKKLNNAHVGNDDHVIVLFKEKSASDQLKTNKNIDNGEETKQTFNELVGNSDSYDQSNNEVNLKENNADTFQNIPTQLDMSSKVVSSSEEEIFQSPNKENNRKREIHLTTGEKSWQLNEKPDKSKLTQQKIDKKKLQKSEDNADSESLKQTVNDLENDETKELDSLKLTKVEKEDLNNDENIMTSVVEGVVDDINKLKVKKDVGLNNVLNDIRSENKLNSQDINILRSQDNIEDRIPKTNKKVYVPSSNNVQDKGKIVVNNQKPYIIKKEPDKNAGNSEGTAAGHVVEDITTKNSGNIEEIIIRIKAPDNTLNSVKQTIKSDADKTNKDNALVIDTFHDKDNIITLPVQNNQINQNILNSLTNEINKRKVLDKLGTGPPNNQDEKIDLQNTSADVEPQQEIKKEDNDQSKTKNKREDTIHLIIETDPEINQANNNEANVPKPNLFCQGKNCLEIKPVVLNESIPAAVAPPNIQSTFNNTSTDTSKMKFVEKREAEEGSNGSFEECSAETTTPKPLLCFDFFNKLFTLELMIAVDYKVVKMHDDDDIENFILTIVNMVSTNFYDKSIGINLSVVLIRLILLTTCIKELDSDQFNPEELLENFCTWQFLINPGKDDHPHHHDLAIFVTRMDKCEGQVMGVTYMTSVCRPDKACLVCIDEGLLLANTITHQIGHSFGAEHDDGQSSGCSSTAPDGTSYHMAPIIRETSYSWSDCSRDSIIQFLRTQGSWCLTDLGSERTYNFPLMLPGQIYSAAQQCRLNYHMAALPCAIGTFCERLYCQVTDKLCATKGDPPADGTFCAANMWCFHKECVHIGRRPGAINGEWGPWTEWSTCTRSCGGGVSSSYRICNNPKPSHGGRYCVGDRMRHKMCATQPCQGFSESFRDMQCKRTEDRPFRGTISNWVQYHSFFINIECSLVCQNRKGNVVMRSPIVADGTPCKAGTRNVCIQGVCRNVGCDWVIDSFAKEDACGMCHGNSTECKIIQGVFDEPTNQRGMVEFLRIPKNSGMIFIREIAPSINVLAVSGAINRVFYLNGKGSDESMPGDVAFGLTHGVYEVRSAMERIFIRGPTSEDLLVYVTFKETNKGIHYQYAVPDFDPTYIPRYLWQFLDWDPCTDPCSGGSQRAQAKCVEDRGGVVDDHFCTQSSRPQDVIRPCNEFPCQAKWWVSVWSDCICMGPTNLMFRSVLCMRATDESGTRSEIVKESECSNHKKPPTQKPCNESEDTSQNCFIKRSVQGDEMFRSHRDMRRAINPKTANIMSPAKQAETVSQESEIKSNKVIDKSEHKDQTNNGLNQKKEIKLKDIKPTDVKGSVSKLKPKQNDKDTDHSDSKKKTVLKNKESDTQKLSRISNTREDEKNKQQIKVEALPDSVKQVVKLKSDSAVEGVSNKIKLVDTSKQNEDSDPDTNGTPNETSESEDKCKTTTATTEPSSCDQASASAMSLTTCKQTVDIVPHEITTCCKTTILINSKTKPAEATTLRPIKTNLDELDTYKFGITVVPVAPAGKALPQSDPEYMNFGNVGDFSVVDESNGTILRGQQAIDFLEFARNNATEEPVILHEDVH